MSEHNISVVGIDMGATHIRICILSLSGKLIMLEKYSTKEIISKGLLKGLINLISNTLNSQKMIPKKIVIGMPASVSNDKKTILSVPNLPIKSEDLNSLAYDLSVFFKCNVDFERDVNLQLYKDVFEFGLQDDVVLGAYLGTGFGFSIWLNGNIFSGAHGVAGELGHIPYGVNSKACGCGNKGCIESICSGIALKEWYDSQNKDYKFDKLFHHFEKEQYLNTFIVSVAKALATTINLFDPNKLILGGGVINMQAFPIEYLKEKTNESVRKPLPLLEIEYLVSEDSVFSGAIGGARQALNTI